MVFRTVLLAVLVITPFRVDAVEFTSEKVAGVPAIGLGQCDLASKGFVVEEHFIEGSATSYKPTKALTNSGHWEVAPDTKAQVKTRVVVVRPSDAARFNGTVLVEWFNVTGGQDAAPGWSLLHREILRSGYAYVGVSAQRVGVEGGGFSITGSSNPLKQSNSQRYGSLIHPGDAYSFDIFTAAGQLAKGSSDNGVMGPLSPTRVVAMGESQSAVFLTTYINAIDPIVKVYDGYLVDSRFGSAASLSDAGMRGPDELKAVRFREDLRVPVINVITETELLIEGGLPSYLAARQPDNERLRTWEIAGAAHADTYIFAANSRDCGNAPATELAPLYAAASMPAMGLEKPMNSAPQHHLVAMSALHHLDSWMRRGVEPPNADRLQLTESAAADETPSLVLDAHGLAKGGVRTPWVDVPIAKLSGVGNRGGMLATLVGITESFDQKKLGTLYPQGKAQYLEQFKTALNKAVSAGFILAADQDEMVALADALFPGEPSP